MIGFLKKIFAPGPKADLKQLHQNGAVIIDVRTANEFKSGHIKGAVNIPLQNLHNQIGSIKKMNKPVITCCLSGSRSGMAKRVLSQNGIEVYNGGGWFNLQSKIR
jgi:phage shock protein E